MRIDQSKFPALFTDGLIEIPPLMDQLSYDIMIEVVRLAKKNLFYTASSIMDHISASYEKLKPFKNDLQDVCRGLLFEINESPHNILYSISNHTDKVQVWAQIQALNTDGKAFGGLFGGYFIKAEQNFDFYVDKWVQDDMEEVTKTVCPIILANELFINYAEVETKVMQPNRQIWDGPRAAYNNKTKFPITVVDSTWFTHLVSSGAFKVRGHFRLQACGHGLKDRKLTWINDFQKDGYTRKAKIENL